MVYSTPKHARQHELWKIISDLAASTVDANTISLSITASFSWRCSE